ncbi:MAG: ABC transporter ATP-binding protein [Candidatus Sulfotelmatobacter sp.]
MVPILNAAPVDTPALNVTAPLTVAAPVAISLENVTVSYQTSRHARRTILDSINLQIEQGEFVVVLGATGCGKSTLLRLILGQEQPTSGRIHVSGRPVERVDARSGYVPQKYSLFPDRTVLDNLTMGPETTRFHILGRISPRFAAFRRQVRREALRQLEHMGLSVSDAGKYPHQLSGGMQQRVAIGQALMMKSHVLLMDEAFSALDPGTRASLQRLMRSVWQEQRPTVVFVTHNTAEALFLGTRLIVLARHRELEEERGCRIVFDRQLPADGMNLRRHGQAFLDLVDEVEHYSRAGCAADSFADGESE